MRLKKERSFCHVHCLSIESQHDKNIDQLVPCTMAVGINVSCDFIKIQSLVVKVSFPKIISDSQEKHNRILQVVFRLLSRLYFLSYISFSIIGGVHQSDNKGSKFFDKFLKWRMHILFERRSVVEDWGKLVIKAIGLVFLNLSFLFPLFLLIGSFQNTI